ncbi:MAG: OpgC protein, partial [uncultured Acetobacteraceae bacterium]
AGVGPRWARARRRRPGPAGGRVPRRGPLVHLHRPRAGQPARRLHAPERRAVRRDGSLRPARRLRRRPRLRRHARPAGLVVRRGGPAAPGRHALHRARLPVRGADGAGGLLRRRARQRRLPGRTGPGRLRGAALPRAPGSLAAAVPAGLPRHPAALHRAAAAARPRTPAIAPAAAARRARPVRLRPRPCRRREPAELDGRRLVPQPVGVAGAVLHRLRPGRLPPGRRAAAGAAVAPRAPVVRRLVGRGCPAGDRVAAAGTLALPARLARFPVVRGGQNRTAPLPAAVHPGARLPAGPLGGPRRRLAAEPARGAFPADGPARAAGVLRRHILVVHGSGRAGAVRGFADAGCGQWLGPRCHGGHRRRRGLVQTTLGRGGPQARRGHPGRPRGNRLAYGCAEQDNGRM